VIKVLGTKGGGFFNANSAHPYENPTALTYLAQMLLLIAIAAGLTNVLGRMARDERHGWALFAVMSILLLIGVATVYWSESHGNPAFTAFNVDSATGKLQAGGNMEGKKSASASPLPRFSRRSPPMRAVRSMRCMTAFCRWAEWY
jgi:potassium-transporting ATPase potassium-binding subunit